MISKEQVADLREGDIVELRDREWPDVVTRGPLHMERDMLCLGPLYLRQGERVASPSIGRTLTVVSRAPRPLYVNHPRTEPVASDVIRREGDEPWRMFGYSGDRWVLVGGTHEYETADLQDAPFRLLVDGETGQVVP